MLRLRESPSSAQEPFVVADFAEGRYVDPKEYADTLHEDLQLRKALMKCPEVQGAEISNIEISRKPQRVTVLISTSRPGVIIGAKGANIEKIEIKQ